MFVAAQIIGGVVLVLTVIGVQFKTKEKILLSQIIANSLISVQYFLLNALTGGVVSIINIIRCIIFYIYKKKNMNPSSLLLVIFVVISIVSGIFTWQNIFSLIPIIAAIVFTYGLWQDNVKITKICTAITAGNWLIYNAIVQAYVGAIQFLCECVSSIIAIIRYKKQN